VNDADLMARTLALADTVRGRTGDNPAVGCLIVKDGVVVGIGATGLGGRPHAEEAALAQAGEAARAGTAYVTLEPCARRSQGGASCTDLLLAAGVARVVVAARDPHPLAAGAGLARLREAGVVVELGLMEAEARALNAAFLARWSSHS